MSGKGPAIPPTRLEATEGYPGAGAAAKPVVVCGDCGAPMELRPSRFGKFWGCTKYPACRGTHGAHPDGRPLGIPADRATKDARIAAHAAFDGLWQEGKMKRSQAYKWLAERLGMDRDDCHIGGFDKAMCERVVAACATSSGIPQ